MKRAVLLIACMLPFISKIKAQESKGVKTDDSGMVIIDHKNDDFQTILGSGGTHGGYISFDLQAGQTSDNQNVLELGGRLGWIMNHGFTFGLAGYGLSGSLNQKVIVQNPISSIPLSGIEEVYNIGGGYGGIFIEPILLPKQPVHVSFPIFFGVGGMGYYKAIDFNNQDYVYNYPTLESDVVTVFKPGVDLEFNITRFFRLALSANYRLVNNLELTIDEVNDVKIDPNYLNGFNYGFSLKFGWF